MIRTVGRSKVITSMLSTQVKIVFIVKLIHIGADVLFVVIRLRCVFYMGHARDCSMFLHWVGVRPWVGLGALGLGLSIMVGFEVLLEL